MTHPANGSPEHRKRLENPERLLMLSDGVFAIAITLLVLDVRVPELLEGGSSRDLARAVWDLKPNILAYLISFGVIAIYWDAHHRLFARIAKIDSAMVRLNFAQLCLIAFIPFPTALLAEYNDLFFAVAFYAVFHIAIGLLSVTMRSYATSHGLTREDIDPAALRAGTVNATITLAIFVVSIGIAVVNTQLAMLSWVLVGVAPGVVGRRVLKNEKTVVE